MSTARKYERQLLLTVSADSNGEFAKVLHAIADEIGKDHYAGFFGASGKIYQFDDNNQEAEWTVVEHQAAFENLAAIVRDDWGEKDVNS